MNRQAPRHLNTAILLLAGLVVADKPSPAESIRSSNPKGTNWARTEIVLYDSEGKWGLLYSRGIPYEGSYLEYQLTGQEVVRLDEAAGIKVPTGQSIGTPYAFSTYTPQYGTIRGFSRIAAQGYISWFTVPVPASSLGLTGGPSKEPFGGTPETGHGTGIGTVESTFVADDRNLPSAAVPVTLIPDGASRVPSSTAEYLQGNVSHESIGQETASFPQGWFQIDGSWFVAWGYEETHAPFVIYLPSHNPLGPIRGTFSLTGYSADSVEWVAEDLYSVNWTPLLSSIPGSVDSPSPSEILELNTLGVLEGAFILEPAIREKLLGQSELFTNLKAASDLNQDGVLDAADFVPLQAGALRAR